MGLFSKKSVLSVTSRVTKLKTAKSVRTTIHKNLLFKNSHFTGNRQLKTVVLMRTPLRTLLCALLTYV